MRRVYVLAVVGILCGPAVAQEPHANFSQEIARIFGLKQAGQAAMDGEDLDGAVAAYRDAVDAQTRLLGTDNPETLATMATLAEAYARQECWEHVYKLREQIFDARRRLDGKASVELTWSVAIAALNWSLKLYGGVSDPPQDLARAREVVSRLRARSDSFDGRLSSDNALDMVSRWIEAWTEYRSGNPERAKEIFEPGLGFFPLNPWGHLTMALLCWQTGEKDVALDWYLAACEGVTEVRGPDKDLSDLKQQVEKMMFGEQGAPPTIEPLQYVQVYDRLLEVYPELTVLYIRRGTCAARVGQSEAALQDFRTAVKLRPEDAWNWYSLAMSALYFGRTDEYKKTAVQMYERFAESSQPFDRHLLVIIASLAPNPDIDMAKILEIANRPDRTDATRVPRVLYRAGQYDEALAQMGTDRDGIVVAMIEWQRGNKLEAVRQLAQAAPVVRARLEAIKRGEAAGGAVMEVFEGGAQLQDAQSLIESHQLPNFDQLADVLVGDWVATGTIGPNGSGEILQAGEPDKMTVSLRRAAGGKAIVGTERVTAVNRPEASVESTVLIVWDPVELVARIVACWSDGDIESGSVVSMDEKGFYGDYHLRRADGRQESSGIAMVMESKDKFSWILTSGPREGECLSTWQRQGVSAGQATENPHLAPIAWWIGQWESEQRSAIGELRVTRRVSCNWAPDHQALVMDLSETNADGSKGATAVVIYYWDAELNTIKGLAFFTGNFMEEQTLVATDGAVTTWNSRIVFPDGNQGHFRCKVTQGDDMFIMAWSKISGSGPSDFGPWEHRRLK